MKIYVKLINNTLEHAPINYKNIDDNLIINFNQSEELMIKNGYKELIDVAPIYRLDEHYKLVDYTETDSNIIVNYKIVKNEIPQKTEAELLQEKISAMQDAIDFLLLGGV